MAKDIDFKVGQILIDVRDSRAIVLAVTAEYVQYCLFYAPKEPYYLGKTFKEGRSMMNYNFLVLSEPDDFIS